MQDNEAMSKHFQRHALDILAALGRHPAIPFYETAVAGEIASRLSDLDINFGRDDYGNIIAHYATDTTLLPVALVAHMDHPGFEITEARGHQASARMLGRTPDTVFDQSVPLRIISPSGERRGLAAGRLGPVEERNIRVNLEEETTLPAFAVFDLPDFLEDAGIVRMRALDDLAGCAATLLVLEALTVERAFCNVYGVFTRAEEVGLVGARLLASAGTLPPETIVISVECSRALPGGEHGKGPVIRVGDATSTFSSEAESILLAARQSLQEKNPPIQVQRQLMSGGTCEASAFLLHGYRATGVAFPLGHYHNGLGEETVEAEYIHLSDLVGGVTLLKEAIINIGGYEEPAAHRRLRDRPNTEAQRLLETSIAIEKFSTLD